MKIQAHSFSPTRAAMLVALLGAVATGTKAEAAGKRAGVPKFEGPQEAIVRKRVMQVLKGHGYELAKSREMETGMQSTGALLESDDGFQKVAKELALAVIVTGEVGKKRAKIVIHDGREGSVIGEASFPGANPRKIAADVGRAFWSKLGADVERGKTPSGSKKPQKVVAEAPEDNENAPDSGEAAGGDQKTNAAEGAGADNQGSSEGDSDSGSHRKKKASNDVKMDGNVLREEASSEPSGSGGVPPTLDIAAGAGGVNRIYSYHQDASGLRPHSLPLGGAAAAQIVVYPIAGFTDGAIQHLGVQVNVEQAFGAQSTLPAGDPSFPQGATFGNTVHEFEGGLRYRIPFGALANQLWLSGSGGEHAFLFTGRTKYTPTLNVPDVIYRYARAGVGVRLELPADLSFSLSAGYRRIFNNGGTQFTEFFPHATVQGVDAELYLGYRIMEAFEVRAGGELRRYFSSMHSVAADPLKAGGAIDQYLSFDIGVAYLYGGSARAAVAQAEPEAPPAKKHQRNHEDADQEGGEGGDAPGVETGGGGDAE